MSLLERCRRGEPAAWRELFASRSAQIYRWAVLLGLRPAEAEDASQDVLVTAARRIRSCSAEEALTTWLYQITRRVVANHRRRSWLRRWLPGGKTADEAADAAAFEHQEPGGLDFELETRRCLRRLPAILAEALVMIEVVGLTRVEAARILGVPVGTVASRIRRARQAFREQWHQDAGSVVANPLEENT